TIMSNQQNNETANTVGLMAILGVFIVAGFAFWAVILALFLTLIAVCVQFKPMSFQGQAITAADGRRFIGLGLLGTLPFTALGIDSSADTSWGNQDEPRNPDPIDVTPHALPQPAEPRKPYQFADWDDQEIDPYACACGRWSRFTSSSGRLRRTRSRVLQGRT